MTNLTDGQRQSILHFLLEATSEGKLRHGSIANASMPFRTTRWTVKRLWDRYNASNDDDEIPGDVRSRIKGNSGRKPYDTTDLVERIRKVPQRKSRKMRQLASAVRVSVSVLRRLMQQGQPRRHTNQIKPSLSGMNTTERILFVLSFLNAHGNEFDRMFNVVHVDGIWFNEDVDKHVYYLLDGEEPPVRRRQSKRFIGKTIFLAAVARPRYDHHKKSEFYGKLGIWPLVEEYTAKRASKNHKKGDVYLKNVESVDRDRYRDYLLEHIIPAIKEKWPASGRRERIWIQQDNARPHLSPDDPAIVAAGQAEGWDIRLRCQPPNSPDFNILDLGFFMQCKAFSSNKMFAEPSSFSLLWRWLLTK